MFVKNVVDVARTNISAGIIVHTGDTTTQPFNGNIKDVPYYFYNERVIGLEISLGNLFIHIVQV